MKDFDKAVNTVVNDTSNILILGGEGSGKSQVLEMLTAYMLGKEDICAITNSSEVRGMVNAHPDSTYLYKAKGKTIKDEIITNIEQSLIMIDEYSDMEQLMKNTGIDKRIILTYDANEFKKELTQYFPVIIICGEINKETHEKGIIEVTHY